jgi:solute carrier family 39 (zinc transporter), member 1/2/3
VSPAHGASLSNTTPATDVYSKSGSLAFLFSGIAFHSVLIGITIGVSSGSEFVALWVALCFHQAFEGIALGTSIVSKTTSWKSLLPWLYIVGFSLATPLGAAIGIGIHESYNPNSVDALVATGVIESLAAGILIYSGLTEFLIPDIAENQALKTKSWKAKALTFCSLYAGAALMAVIGLWA